MDICIVGAVNENDTTVKLYTNIILFLLMDHCSKQFIFVFLIQNLITNQYINYELYRWKIVNIYHNNNIYKQQKY